MKSIRCTAIATCLFLSAPTAYGGPMVYGRINLSLERLAKGSPAKTVLQDDLSRIGFVEEEALNPENVVRIQLEHGVDATTGMDASPVFWNRRAEMSVSGPAGMIRIGRFSGEPYLSVADPVSMHYHDSGSSADAFFAHVGRDSGKLAYRTPSLGGFTAEISSSIGVEPWGQDRAHDAVVSYEGKSIRFAATYGAQGRQSQRSVRGSVTIKAFEIAAYLQNDTNVRREGSRRTVRVAAMLTAGAAEMHVNVGQASAYRGMVPGNGSALQLTLGYNYNLSAHTKVYALSTRVRDRGTLYGNVRSVGVGIRTQF